MAPQRGKVRPRKAVRRQAKVAPASSPSATGENETRRTGKIACLRVRRRENLVLMVMSLPGAAPAAGEALVDRIVAPAEKGLLVLGRCEAGGNSGFDDTFVSRRHATLRLDLDADRLLIADAGSANGTRVNCRPIQGEVMLRRNDIVRVGDTMMVVLPVDRLPRWEPTTM